MTSPDTYSAFMLDHVSGSLSPAMHLAADIHRLMSSKGDDANTLWETVRSALIAKDNLGSCPSRHDRQITLALDVIHTDYEQVKWRRGLSGVQYAKGIIKHGQLMRLRPHQSTFSHDHSTLEATVVLEGTLEDGFGRYDEGDILLAEPGLRHKPASYGNHGCTCFVARTTKPFWRFT